MSGGIDPEGVAHGSRWLRAPASNHRSAGPTIPTPAEVAEPWRYRDRSLKSATPPGSNMDACRHPAVTRLRAQRAGCHTSPLQGDLPGYSFSGRLYLRATVLRCRVSFVGSQGLSRQVSQDGANVSALTAHEDPRP